MFLPRERYPPVDAVALPQEFALCSCSPGCALQQLVPGHLKAQPCWGSIEVCCPQPIEAARPLSHKQCRGRGARVRGEMQACARLEHSSLYNVFTRYFLHSANSGLLLLLLLLPRHRCHPIVPSVIAGALTRKP